VELVRVIAAEYRVPGGNRVTLSPQLADEIREHFNIDRDNRFQLFVLAAGIRRKYLNKKTNSYKAEFEKWYISEKMEDLFGKLPNFTKYASAGEVIEYVVKKLDVEDDERDRVLNRLPVSMNSLYELSRIINFKDEEIDGDRLFRRCLRHTPKREYVGQPSFEWKDSKPALIRKSVTSLAIATWFQKFKNPPPPKQKRTDKRTLKYMTITCNGELFNFSKKTGEHTGCVDLPDVEEFFAKVQSLFTEETEPFFRLESHMDYLTEGYYTNKDKVDPSKNIANPSKSRKKPKKSKK
jgi:hypothetical protein